MKFLSSSPAKTRKVAGLLAREIKKSRKKTTPAVVGLEGDLGAGKTTFIQGFARGTGIKRKITSPTFLIMKRYNNLYHVDAYRIKKTKELETLDFKKIIRKPGNVVIIEWADKIKSLLPGEIIWVKIDHGRGKNERIIKIKAKKPK